MSVGKEKINVLSLFDGISCGQIALEKLGIEVENYFASEIDKHAIKVTQHNFPNTIQLGNVLDVKASDLPKIDLLIGGSPCQGFSIAGKKLNFDDDRSKLFFEFVRLKNELNPKYFLLENVRMTDEIADSDSNQYANSWAAGWGLKESVEYFRNEAKDKQIYIATEGTFGLMPAALEMYLVNNKNVKIQGYWPVVEFPADVLKIAKTKATYFVFYQPQHEEIPIEYPLELVLKVKQGNSDSYFRVYKVLSK
jgi:hypothetical protein